MVVSKDKHFQAVQAFHERMDGSVPQSPKAFSYQEVCHRADFKIEEIVELLFATSQSQENFEEGIEHLQHALEKAKCKLLAKNQSFTAKKTLIGQVDALMDLLYFTYGSFVLIGVDPEPIFQIVHEANMGKIWPDGKGHHDPVTHKILKPEHWERDFAPEGRILKELEKQIKHDL